MKTIIAIAMYISSPAEQGEQLIEKREAISSYQHEVKPHLFSLGLGAYNTTRNDHAYDLQLEYRTPWHFLEGDILFGGMITNQASTFLYTGIAWDIFFGVTRWVLTPSFSPGLYFPGKGIHLGFPVEFRSSIALGYALSTGKRIGLQYYHISNCHLGDRNPGVEGITLSYTFPLK